MTRRRCEREGVALLADEARPPSYCTLPSHTAAPAAHRALPYEAVADTTHPIASLEKMISRESVCAGMPVSPRPDFLCNSAPSKVGSFVEHGQYHVSGSLKQVGSFASKVGSFSRTTKLLGKFS